MADKIEPRTTPPRDPGTGTGTQTHVHLGTVPPAKPSGNAMAFIVGGVVVGLVVLYLLYSGFAGDSTTPTSAAPSGSTTIINNDAGTGSGTGGVDTAPAGDDANAPAASEPATGAETEAAPATTTD